MPIRIKIFTSIKCVRTLGQDCVFAPCLLQPAAPNIHQGSRSSACQNSVIAFHLIFLNPCKLRRRTSVSERGSTVEKTGLLAMATPGSSTCRQERKMIPRLAAADNDAAIFTFVFGKGQRSHSTAYTSQLFFFLNSPSVTFTQCYSEM